MSDTQDGNGTPTRMLLEDALRVVEEAHQADVLAERKRMAEFRDRLAELCAEYRVTLAVSAPTVVVIPTQDPPGDLS